MSASPPSPASSEEEGEGEEREEFYESLDRILSSSCSSTSASDDEADHHRRGHHHHHPLPRFPPASAASLDVWLSEPATVEERRRRLLQQMGLSRDPTLARRRPGDCRSPRWPNGGHNDAGDLRRPGEGEIGRSVSSDGLSPRPRPYSAVVIGRSRSEGSVDPSTVNKQQQQRPAVALPTPNKPPLVGGSRPPSAGNLELSDGEDAAKGDGGGCVDEDRRCTIRNLDNGKEFVVKEFREDGMWNQLREVGTGRQLTMEEFELCVGHSPIVQELMRRQNVADSGNGSKRDGGGPGDQPRSGATEGVRSKKRGSWLKSIKNVAGTVVGGRHNRDMRSSDERDTSSEKGGRRSSSATDDSQEGPHDGPQRIKVRQYGKPHKELSFLYMSQEIQAHSGSIWSIKFSFDGRYLASAGEDCVIHVWQVSEHERKGELLMDRGTEENGNRNPFVNGSPEPALALAYFEGNHLEKKRRAKVTGGRKSVTSDQLMVPEHVFALSDKPVCTFWGHLADVLDLSWSKSQYLLSSSMDKTVRLWHMSSNSCLRTFSHSDYVTCIQFNPVDDRYFISGSLDEKVRIWSIPDRQVVDWNDLHEMVTAACYTPDGQGALVGSHKGSCHLYNTSDNKLHQRSQIDLQNKKKKSSSKKITGFQFAPGSSSEVLITSADSRIRVIDGVELVHKFKGFRNTSSQISASLTPDGNYVICASEDSHVYVWRHDTDSRPGRSKGAVPATQSYEHFHCQNVTVAVSWPGTSSKPNQLDGVSHPLPPVLSDANWHGRNTNCQEHRAVLSTDAGHCSDRVSATWPEENLLITAGKRSPQSNGDICSWGMPMQSRSAWGMVIVTAGRGGEIITFQNFGIPVRL